MSFSAACKAVPFVESDFFLSGFYETAVESKGIRLLLYY